MIDPSSFPLAPKIEVRESSKHGKGVFACAPIKKGDHIITFTGPLWHRSECDFDDYHLQVGPEHYLGPSGSADDYVNHSCEPNAGFEGGLHLVAKRDIERDEEITMDYGAVIDEHDFDGFPCTCGASTCRGLVQSFRHLAPLKQQQLKPWVLPYLRELYFR